MLIHPEKVESMAEEPKTYPAPKNSRMKKPSRRKE
jgi:hypothetical protein